MLRTLFAVVLAGCGATSSTGAATAPEVPAEMGARVFYSRDELGPIASLVDPSLDLEGRVLVLPGLVVPTVAAEVVVRDPTSPTGAMVPAAVTSASAGYLANIESVRGAVVDGHLALTYLHDANTSGYCCSGIEMPDRADCASDPPLPPVPRGDDVRVWLFVVPRDAANGITVARETSVCVRP